MGQRLAKETVTSADQMSSPAGISSTYLSAMGSVKDGWNAVHMAAFVNDVSKLSEAAVKCPINSLTNDGDSAIHIASHVGAEESVLCLLQLNADPNVQNKVTWFTPLHYACHRNYVNICKVLLTGGADPNMSSKSGFTPLHAVATLSYVKLVPVLLEGGADINSGVTMSPLDVARTSEMIRLLESLGANRLFKATKSKVSRLNRSSTTSKSSPNKVNSTLSPTKSHSSRSKSMCNTADFSQSNSSPIINSNEAVSSVDESPDMYSSVDDSPRPLSSAMPSSHPSSIDTNILFNAARDGDMVSLNTYFSSASVNSDCINIKDSSEWTPLHWACMNGHCDIVTALVDRGADVRCQGVFGEVPLHLAAYNDHSDVVTILVSKPQNDLNSVRHVADPDYRNFVGNTALHYALFGNSTTSVSVLCKSGASVNVIGEHGNTPLHVAIQRHMIDAVHILLEAGADINVKNLENNTALTLSLKESIPLSLSSVDAEEGSRVEDNRPVVTNEENIDVIHGIISDLKQKLKEGIVADDIVPEKLKDMLSADQSLVDHVWSNGRSILHEAAFAGLTGICTLLLSMGADPNVRNEDRRTPLHRAAFRGHVGIIILLVGYHADVNAVNKGGWTPLHLAASKGQKASVETLLTLGASSVIKNEFQLTAAMCAAQNGFKDVAEMISSYKPPDVPLDCDSNFPDFLGDQEHLDSQDHGKAEKELRDFINQSSKINLALALERALNSGNENGIVDDVSSLAHDGVQENIGIEKDESSLERVLSTATLTPIISMNQPESYHDIETASAKKVEDSLIIPASKISSYHAMFHLISAPPICDSFEIKEGYVYNPIPDDSEHQSSFPLMNHRFLKLKAWSIWLKYVFSSGRKRFKKKALLIKRSIDNSNSLSLAFRHWVGATFVTTRVSHRSLKSSNVAPSMSSETVRSGSISSITTGDPPMSMSMNPQYYINSLHSHVLRWASDTYRLAFCSWRLFLQDSYMNRILESHQRHIIQHDLYKKSMSRSLFNVLEHCILIACRSRKLVGLHGFWWNVHAHKMARIKNQLVVRKDIERWQIRSDLNQLVYVDLRDLNDEESKIFTSEKYKCSSMDSSIALTDLVPLSSIVSECLKQPCSRTLCSNGIDGNLSRIETLNAKTVESPSVSQLHMSAKEGDIGKIESLLRNPSIDVNSFDDKGSTALHHVAWLGRVDSVIVLLRAGANPNILNAFGWTPLQRAAYRGNTDVVEALLIAGADANRMNDGFSAVHMAAMNGHADAVDCLLLNGADGTMKTAGGQSLAQKASSKAVLDVLVKHHLHSI